MQKGWTIMNNFIFENKTKVYFGKGGVKEYLGSQILFDLSLIHI